MMVAKLQNQISEYFVGKEEVVKDLLICLFSGGHVLLEDVPGVGKTTLAAVLSKSVDCDFGRIQFTPDTLPGDVVGTEIYQPASGSFSYRAGAIMHQIVLADEINRTSPKTQSALLEAMAEGQVSVGDEIHALPAPFMVIATQNPVEFMGTYPLPEAQMDRFMMKLSLGYPSEEEELRMARNELSGKRISEISAVITTADVLRIREEVKQVRVKDSVLKYLRELIDATRREERFTLGASPRALLSLLHASQGHAYLEGRDYVTPDDIKAMIYPVLRHRLNLTNEARIAKESPEKILQSIIIRVAVPLEH